jgi:hypothetical protein
VYYVDVRASIPEQVAAGNESPESFRLGARDQCAVMRLELHNRVPELLRDIDGIPIDSEPVHGEFLITLEN